MEDTWTVLVKKNWGGVHNIIPCLFKKKSVSYILEWGQTRGSSLHTLIIIAFHFPPMRDEEGRGLAQRQGSDSVWLVDFYRCCMRRR